VAFTAAAEDGVEPGVAYQVDVPGGELTVTFCEGGHVEMTGPAVLTLRGELVP
jgi:diaminopimelate epimerase